MTFQAFDADSLWKRIDGDLELLRDLVAVFISELPEMLEQVELGIRQGAAAEVRKASHKIKGSALQFSAHPAVAAAQKLEEMGKKGSLDGAEPFLIELRRELDALVAALQEMISKNAGKNDTDRKAKIQ